MIKFIFILFIYSNTIPKIYQHSKLTKNALLFTERGFCFDLNFFVVVDNVRIGKIKLAAIHKMVAKLYFEFACHFT